MPDHPVSCFIKTEKGREEIPELKSSFKTSAIAVAILVIGYFAVAYLPDVMKKRTMVSEARHYLTQQLDKWKRGEENEIKGILSAFVSSDLKQWMKVTLLDYKIKSLRKVDKRVHKFFGSRRCRYVSDPVKAKTILTIEDENGIESSEEAVYHIRALGKHRWKTSNY